MHPPIKPGTQQHKILQFLAAASDWSSRQDMYRFVGSEKGYSKALAERTGTQHPDSLVARGLVEQAPFAGFPLLYRVTQRGRDELNAIGSAAFAPRRNRAAVVMTSGRFTASGTDGLVESADIPMPMIQEFDAEIRRLTNEHPAVRPFLCHGLPYPAEVMLVGLNPGVSIPFWPHWSPVNGCNKNAWLSEYRKSRSRLAPTRKRIEILFDALQGFRCVEANLFPLPSERLSALPHHLRSTELFDYLLRVLRPRLLYVHGAETVAHVATRANCVLPLDRATAISFSDWTGVAFGTRHLSFQWSDSRVRELGTKLRSILSNGTLSHVV